MTHDDTGLSTKILPRLRDIASAYDIILCDIWGVLHNGESHFAAAADALGRYRAGGGRVVLITNAPRPAGPIRRQLDELLVPRAAYDAMVTSGDVTIQLIAARGAQKIHHIGPPRDLALFDEVREATGHAARLVPLHEADYVVCTGLFDDDTETPANYQATFSAMLAGNLPMISANPDIVVHRGTTLLYCAGALAQAYAGMGGQVQQAGKPFAPIYERALLLAGSTGTPRVLAIGDALATDMRGAQHAGIDGLFITGGIHRDDLHGDGGIDLSAAGLGHFLAEADLQPRYAMPALCW